MTLVISTMTSSGIVLTADSRQTYRNQAGAVRIGSDNAMKIFKLNNNCGVGISGRAFLRENDQPAKDVGYYITRFTKEQNLEGVSTLEIAQRLNHYIGNIFIGREMEAMRRQIEERVKKLGGSELAFFPSDSNLIPYSYKERTGNVVSDTGWVDTINMLVAGIDSDLVGRVYTVSIPKGIIQEGNTQSCGALWVGQSDVLSRIVKGYGPEIERLHFVKDALTKNNQATLQEFNKLEYIINWGTITLQDAIDFCVLMTRITESIQRFSDGTVLVPGGIPGVGGDIDIAVFTPDKGFQWLKKKVLKLEGLELFSPDID